MSNPVIRTEKLVKEYHDGERTLRVLKGVELTVERGETVAITGASGSGKSTLLNLLGGLDRPTSGSIFLNGEDLATMSVQKVNLLRRDKVGYVFQFHHLLSEFHAWENVAMPALVAGCPRSEARGRAMELLETVGLADRAGHIPSKLSGGEQQRVSLARALINNPHILFADEPTGNLDEAMGRQVIDLLWKMTKERGKSLVIVTHEPQIAKRADRALLLRDGRLSPA